MPARGFTLVELVLVLAILGVVGAIALPRYAQTTANYQVRLAAERLAQELIHARATAQAKRTPVTVTLDVANDRIACAQVNGLNGQPLDLSLADEPYGVDLHRGPDTLTFDAFGNPDAGHTLAVRLGARSQTVTIRESGEVTTP